MTAESTFTSPDGTARWTPSAPTIGDPRQTLEAVAREITTGFRGSKGPLFWARQRGVEHPYQQLVNASPSDADLRRIEVEYTQAAGRVPGVLSAKFRLRRTAEGIEMAAEVTPTGAPAARLFGDAAGKVSVG